MLRPVCALLLVGGAAGAGMTAHNLMAYRAQQHFEESVPGFEALVATNWPSISAGAPFPDYLYVCGDSHDAGEEDHWPPFQTAAANYIRANWTLDEVLTEGTRANRLAAFMIGAVTHYVTDMNWHGIGTVPSPQGFIEQLGVSNFNCSGELCQVAHSTADVGGEFVAAWEVNLTFFEPAAWEVPVDDIVRIFAYANATLDPSQACYGAICFPLVEPEWVSDCAYLFGVGSWAIKEFGAIVYPYWEITAYNDAGAPHLTEAFLGWPVGGVDGEVCFLAGMVL